LMPGVPHMVHMASHSYQRTGLYAKGVVINDSANAAQKNYSILAPQLRLSTDVIHYDAVQTFCAMNGAMYGKAMQAARKCRDITMAHEGVVNTNLQFLSSMPLFVLVRSGKWQAILDQPAPDSRWIYSSLLSDFARGMAYAHLGKTAPAQACLDSLRVLLKDPSLGVRHRPFNAAVKPGAVAEGILEGELLFIGGKTDAAMTAFRLAIESEDGMDYLEPNEWPLPARQYAGAVLLRQGRFDEAEKLYQEDLIQNPGNGWALLGLAQSLEMQHNKDGAEYRKKAEKAFAEADVMPPASVY
jgi:tetratricopeptide (TPR) repeat protein